MTKETLDALMNELIPERTEYTKIEVNNFVKSILVKQAQELRDLSMKDVLIAWKHWYRERVA